MFDNLFSLLIGVLEVNTEFNLTNTSVLFLNSGFAMGSELANAGLNGPSTYPYTSFGARAKIDFPNKI